jgi:hypothetical protein
MSPVFYLIGMVAGGIRMVLPTKSAEVQTGRKNSRAFAVRLGMGTLGNEDLPFCGRADLGAVGEPVSEMAAFEMPPHELFARTEFQIAGGWLTV